MSRQPSLLLTAPPTAISDARIVHYRGERFAAVMLKLELSLVPERLAVIAPPEARLDEPIFERADPTRSVVEPADSTLRRGPASVTAWLVAHPWPGRSEQLIRLALFRGRDMKIDKTALLRWTSSDAPSVGLGYEICQRNEHNPVGSERPRLTQRGSSPHAPSFGAESQLWPRRRTLRGNTTVAALSGRLVRLSDDFDWEYLQLAPKDQRLDDLQPGDWVLIEGLSPALPRLATQLPPVHAQALVGDGANQRRVALSMQDLHLDPDRMRATLSLRAEIRLEESENDVHIELRFTNAGATSSSSPPRAHRNQLTTKPGLDLGATPAEPVAIAPYELAPPRTKKPSRAPTDTPFGGGIARRVTPVDRPRYSTAPLTQDDLKSPSSAEAYPPIPAPADSIPLAATPPAPIAIECSPEEELPPENDRDREIARLRELGISDAAIRQTLKRRPWIG